MTRSFDMIPNETEGPAEIPKPSTPVMSVCPFCGAIAEKIQGACPRCKMENSPQTRQATRARVGPWYVMQSRNPSAPGMKCNTLLALIRKGQITPRSVIRGPTTFQLWRFAARVKGISREFGLCYSCGSEVQRTSTFCARCSRSQELPPNPDALLEHEPQQQNKTIFREPPVRASAPPEPVRPAPRSDPARSDPVGSPQADSRPPGQLPSAAETMAELAGIPSPHSAPPELQSRPRQRPQEGVLTPRELAAAFSLQYDPSMDGRAGSSRRSRRSRKRWLVAAAVLSIVGVGAAVYFYVPSVRDSLFAWIQDASPAATPSASTTPPATADTSPTVRQPEWTKGMMTPPDISQPITAPPQPANMPASIADASKNIVPSSGQPDASSTPAPAFHFDPPTVTDPRTRAAAQVAAKLRQADNGDLDTLAMQLRGDGMDAENSQDFVSAQYFYQQVEALPRDHWPGDIEQRLRDVQTRLAAADGH
jgi:hypothetical protein